MLSLPKEPPPSPMLLVADLRTAAAAGDIDGARAIGKALAAELAHLLTVDLEAGQAALGFLCSWHWRAEVATVALEVCALTCVASAVLGRKAVSAAPMVVDGRCF